MAEDSQLDELYRDAVRGVLELNRYLRKYSRTLQAEGVTGKQLSTLRHLQEEGACTMGELASFLFLNDSTVSEHVAKLEKKGYLRRERSAGDNRVVRVTISEAGNRIAADTPLGGVPLLRERLGGLSPAKLRQIRSTVRLLVDLMEVDSAND